MNKASRYWNYKKAPAAIVEPLGALLRNSEPFHQVTHRAIGDIPGCTPAPREHIYRPVTIEQARAENALRADRFIKALDDDQFGPSFRGDHMSEPLLGPYGEKL